MCFWKALQSVGFFTDVGSCHLKTLIKRWVWSGYAHSSHNHVFKQNTPLAVLRNSVFLKQRAGGKSGLFPVLWSLVSAATHRVEARQLGAATLCHWKFTLSTRDLVWLGEITAELRFSNSGDWLSPRLCGASLTSFQDNEIWRLSLNSRRHQTDILRHSLLSLSLDFFLFVFTLQ